MSCHYRSNPSTLAALSAEHSAARVQSVQADLTQESEVQRMFDAASGAFGPVQVVIANHGY